MSKTKIIAGGGLVLNNAGELLMIFRRGKWDLPKGKLDEGETILECAIREVQEETGLQQIEHGELIGITYHAYFDPYLKEDVIKESHWFAMRVRGNQVLTPQTEEDITEIKWVAGDVLEECLRNSYDNVVEIIGKAEL
jgi:8-oxo-dGTP pyrophosphatase MutT (NUDIX family)